jgi:hypothetical protein
MALHRDTALAVRLLDRYARPEGLKHALGVVARRLGLDDRGAARRIERGQQCRRLHLGRRHRQAVFDRHGALRTVHHDGHAPARRRLEARAEAAQRLYDAPHRPAHEGGVAGERRGDRGRGDEAGGKPRARPRIAEIERHARAREAADAGAVDVPSPVVAAPDRRPERRHGARRIEHVFGLEQAGHDRFTDSRRPQHEGTVGDRLVAGNGDAAAQGAGSVGGEPDGLGHLFGSRWSATPASYHAQARTVICPTPVLLLTAHIRHGMERPTSKPNAQSEEETHLW